MAIAITARIEFKHRLAGFLGVSWAVERSEKDPKELPIHRISRKAILDFL